MEKESILFALSRLREHANEYLAQQLALAGCQDLAPSHGTLLALLYQYGPMPMSVLAQRADKRKNTVTALVARLEQNGYVQRVGVPADNRVRHVALTEKAWAFQDRFEKISTAMQEQLWHNFSAQEVTAFCSILQRMDDNITPLPRT